MDKDNKRIAILHDRAVMLAKAREFFTQRNVIEVDCPILSHVADIDTHINLITALYHQTETCYLHPSPEYGMKCLLSEGIGDIYQLSHVATSLVRLFFSTHLGSGGVSSGSEQSTNDAFVQKVFLD